MARNERLVMGRDVSLALALLTRLPLPVDTGFAATRGARASWAYPLAGFAVAGLAGGFGLGVLALGVTAPIAAGLALALQIVLTGAMHEDGLADSADGLWGGYERERRLEIMKDSHIGTYGVLALILSILLRWFALAALGAAMLPAMIATSGLSRAAMALLMHRLPHARQTGLSHSVGRPELATTLLGWIIAAVVALIVAQELIVALLLVAVLSAISCAAVARSKIGGQTGDVLGATQQVTEIVCLVVAAAILT